MPRRWTQLEKLTAYAVDSDFVCDSLDEGSCNAPTSTVVGTVYDGWDCHASGTTTRTDISYFDVPGIMLVTHNKPTSTSSRSGEQQSGDQGSRDRGSGGADDGDQGSASGRSGLSRSAVIAVATVIPLVVIALCIGVFFFLRRKRERSGPGKGQATEAKHSDATNDWTKAELQGSQQLGRSMWNDNSAAKQELGGEGISEAHGYPAPSTSELSPIPAAPTTYELYSSWGQSAELHSTIPNVNSPYELGEKRASESMVASSESPAPLAHNVDGSSSTGSNAAPPAGDDSPMNSSKNEVLDGLRSRQLQLARQLKEQEEMIARLEKES